jgi:membrane protein required for colicin V production
LSSIDIALLAIILLGAIMGYKEGFLMELFSFFALVLGVLGAFKLLGWAMLLLSGYFDLDKDILPYVAFGVVFLIIVIVVRLIGNMIKLSIDKTFLGRIDQVAGAGIGFLKTIFILSVLFWIIESLNYHIPEKYIEDSWIMPKVVSFAPMITSWIGEVFPVFKDVF